MNNLRKSLLAVVLSFGTLMASAQATQLSGVAIDSITHEPVPYATVRIYGPTDKIKPVGMSLTDDNGHFAQEITGKGNFSVNIASIGKLTTSKTVVLNGEPTTSADTIYMADDARAIAGVEVVAQRPLVKMETDKMTYNVQDDPDAQSATVLDMLRKVPMVVVDGQDNITVKGSSSFKVYVNGKPNAMFSSSPSKIFKAMPASAVQNIEVITNPGAKYDAEGAVGVLNLTLRQQGGKAQNMNGMNGSVTGIAGNKNYGGSVYVAGQQGKFSFNANILYSRQRIKGIENEIDRKQKSANGDSQMHSITRLTNNTPFAMGSLSLGYDIDSLNTLGATVNYSGYNMKQDGNSTNSFKGGVYGSGFEYSNLYNTQQKNHSFNVSADYQHFFSAKHDRYLVLSYQFTSAPTNAENTLLYDNSTTIANEFTYQYSKNNAKTQEHTIQADFTQPMGTGHTLNYGLKYIGRKNSSEIDYIDDVNYSDPYTIDGTIGLKYSQTSYNHHDDILAGYAEYSGTFNKFGTKAGLRYEYTWQNVKYLAGNGENFNTNYGNLVPSASFTYNISPMQNLGLTYNLRISRPGITYLNPYVNRSLPTVISYGNPDLKTVENHNIGMVYNFFTPKLMLNVSLQQTICGNALSEYSFMSDNVLNSTYGNIVRERNSSLSVFANWLAAKNTRLIFNGGLSYADLYSKTLAQANNGWGTNFFTGVQQTMPWEVKLSAYLIMQGKSYTLQGWNSGFQGLNGSISKSFCKDRFNVSIAGLYGFSENGSFIIKMRTNGNDFSNSVRLKIPIALFQVHLAYNFGNSKVQVKAHKSNIQNDFIEKKSETEQTQPKI